MELDFKSKVLLGDGETFTTDSEEVLADIIKYRNKNDKIFVASIRSLHLEIREEKESYTAFRQRINCPLPLKEVKEHCVSGNGIFLTFKVESGELCYPIRDIAWRSILERARLGGFTFVNTLTGPDYKPMDLKMKVDFINEAFTLYGGVAQILYRDHKITSVMSGQYYFISQRAIDSGIRALKNDFKNIRLGEATISHEFIKEIYFLEATEVEEDILFAFAEAGFPAENVKLFIGAHSGDYGNIAATYVAKMMVDDKAITFGAPQFIKHSGKKTDKMLAEEARKLFASFEENSEAMKSLMATTINHPAGCLRMIAKEYHMPKKITMSIADSLEGKSSVSAFEIYWHLNDIVAMAEADGIDFVRAMNLHNEVAKTLKVNYKKFDKPFTWLRDDAKEE